MAVPLNTVHDLEKNADSIWQYAASNWARQSSQSINRNTGHQNQAIVSRFWRKVQAVVFYLPSSANYRQKKILTKDLVALREQARGCLLNLAAAAGHDEDDYYGILKTCSDAIAEDLSLFMSDRYSDFVKLYKVRRNQCYVGF